eukprot:1114756-Rhodomonas_salina.1
MMISVPFRCVMVQPNWWSPGLPSSKCTLHPKCSSPPSKMTLDVAFVCRMPFPFVVRTTGLPWTSIVGKEHAAAGTSIAQLLMPSRNTFGLQ